MKNQLFPKQRFLRTGFTLIELLVVITIIAILAGILIPVIATAMKKAEIAQAQSTVQGIVAAVTAYENTYGKLPLHQQHQGKDDIDYLHSANYNSYGTSRWIVMCLTAESASHDTTKKYNPREQGFLTSDNLDNGSFPDPWGNQYAMRFDNNYDGKITLKSGRKLVAKVVAWSYGPDETNDWADPDSDDVVSYNK